MGIVFSNQKPVLVVQFSVFSKTANGMKAARSAPPESMRF